MSANAKLNRSAAYASISVALLLVGLKGWAVLSTGSTAMLGSLADTVLDLVASVATLAGVWVAAMPADDDHRFGHGKAEALAAMFQVVLISLSAISLAFRALTQLIAGARPSGAEDGILVSGIAIAATLALLAWQRHVIARTGSLAIATDNLHYRSDLALNLAVIAALALDRYAGFAGADPLFGLAIAGWLGWGAWRASHAAIEQLMDKEWPEDKKAQFLEVAARHPELRGLHDLRTRTSGDRDFVQFHVWVDPDLTMRQVHDVMEDLEARLTREFPGIEILIHPDPEGQFDGEGASEVDLLADLPAAQAEPRKAS